jgi:hypothetical protein
MKKLIEKMASVFHPGFLAIGIFLILSILVYSTEASVWRVVPESDWELLAENKDFKYYVDKQSIRKYTTGCFSNVCFPWYRSDGSDYPPARFIRAWIKKIGKAPKQYEATEELDYEEYDCTKERSRLLHLTKIYPDGINESINLNVVIKWDNIPPDKIEHFFRTYLCKNR